MRHSHGFAATTLECAECLPTIGANMICCHQPGVSWARIHSLTNLQEARKESDEAGVRYLCACAFTWLRVRGSVVREPDRQQADDPQYVGIYIQGARSAFCRLRSGIFRDPRSWIHLLGGAGWFFHPIICPLARIQTLIIVPLIHSSADSYFPTVSAPLSRHHFPFASSMQQGGGRVRRAWD